MRTSEFIYISRKGDHVFGYVCGHNMNIIKEIKI
jgi:hypothetical protein